jgi:hypothetical protein
MMKIRYILVVLLLLVAVAASAAGIGATGGTLTGKDAFKKTMVSRTAQGGLKKKVIARGKDPVAPIIVLDPGATTGAFTILQYEDFPVTGTWTLASNKVTLAVDAASFATQKGPELCPAASCTPTAIWTPGRTTFSPKKSTLKAKWLVTLRQTNADGSYVEETFKFKGAGTLSPSS